MSVHHESLQFKIFVDETADGIADFCNDYGMPANGLKRVATSLRDGLHSQGQSKSGQLPLFVTGSIESTKGVTKSRPSRIGYFGVAMFGKVSSRFHVLGSGFYSISIIDSESRSRKIASTKCPSCRMLRGPSRLLHSAGCRAIRIR
jgi:hypothetical protein